MSAYSSYVKAITFLILMSTFLVIGPALESFDSASIVEFFAFYAYIFVLFFAGVYFKGKANRRVTMLLGVCLILNHKLLYMMWPALTHYTYAKFFMYFFAALPGALVFHYYHYLQSRAMNALDRTPLSERMVDKIVGPMNSTNFLLVVGIYWYISLGMEFTTAIYSVAYGLYFDVPAYNGRIGPLIDQYEHFDPWLWRDWFVILFDSAFVIAMTMKVLLDQERPDALGTGHTMVWTKSH